MYYFQTFWNPKIHGVFQILLGICRRKMTMKASQHCAKTYVIRGSDFLTALFGHMTILAGLSTVITVTYGESKEIFWFISPYSLQAIDIRFFIHRKCIVGISRIISEIYMPKHTEVTEIKPVYNIFYIKVMCALPRQLSAFCGVPQT